MSVRTIFRMSSSRLSHSGTKFAQKHGLIPKGYAEDLTFINSGEIVLGRTDEGRLVILSTYRTTTHPFQGTVQEGLAAVQQFIQDRGFLEPDEVKFTADEWYPEYAEGTMYGVAISGWLPAQSEDMLEAAQDLKKTEEAIQEGIRQERIQHLRAQLDALEGAE